MVRFRSPYNDPSQPDLVQLGFLMVDTSDWKVRDQGCFLVQLRNSSVGIEEGAQRVHGISEADCSEFGIEHETALDLFQNLCSKADILVAHNIRFDAIVMETAFHRGLGESSFSDLLSSKRKICTMVEAIDLCKLPSKFSNSSSNSTSYKWPSLEEAYKFVTGGDQGDGEILEGAHDALVDSQACLKVFRYLVEHGHVSLERSLTESSDTTVTARKSKNPITTVSEPKRPPVSPDDSTTTPSPATVPSTSVLFPDIEATNDDFDSNPEGMHNYVTPERNGGIDRSREIEEAAKASPRLHDPASFSPDMLENGTDENSSDASTHGGGFRVSGKTYAHKEMIKELGGRWNGQSKEWVFHETQHLSKLESYKDLIIVRFSDE